MGASVNASAIATALEFAYHKSGYIPKKDHLVPPKATHTDTVYSVICREQNVYVIFRQCMIIIPLEMASRFAERFFHSRIKDAVPWEDLRGTSRRLSGLNFFKWLVQ
jgi:hypothetical protein